MTTPSHHRSRLGPLGQSGTPADFRPAPMGSQNRSPSRRQPFNTITGNSMSKPTASGYGMSAGLKVGRQQGNGIFPSPDSILSREKKVADLRSRVSPASRTRETLHASVGTGAAFSRQRWWALLLSPFLLLPYFSKPKRAHFCSSSVLKAIRHPSK